MLLVPPPETVASGIEGGGGGTRRWLPTRGTDLFVCAPAAVAGCTGFVAFSFSVGRSADPGDAGADGCPFCLPGLEFGAWEPTDPMLATKPAITNSPVSIRL